MRWIGLDFGTKTIGLAISDEDGIIATPLKTLSRQSGPADMDAIAVVVGEFEIQGLVLGLPLEMTGREGHSAKKIRAFGEQLAARLQLPLFFWDERFSTVAAERALIEADVRRNRRKRVINHVAAALILQSFLDSPAQHGAKL